MVFILYNAVSVHPSDPFVVLSIHPGEAFDMMVTDEVEGVKIA